LALDAKGGVSSLLSMWICGISSLLSIYLS
jgi:hypothetical protein